MRKLFVAVAALGMLLTSCAKDDALSGGNGATVSFNIAQPTIASRALGTVDATGEYGTGFTTEDLQYAIFEAEVDAATGVYTIRDNGQKPISGVVDAFFKENSLKNTLDGIRLVRGKHYIAFFFAQSDATEGNWNIDWTTQTMSLKNPTALKAQDESLDAFFTRVDFKVEPTASNQSFDAVLTRPFAQVNVLTNDAEEAQAAGLDVYQTSMEVVGVYTSMNLVDGSVSGETTLVYDMAEKGNMFMNVNGTDYDLLSMNYLLVNTRETVDIIFRYNEDAKVAGNDNTVFEAEFDMVPVERNYRTNIIGSILTSAVSFQIVINPIFTDDIIHDITKSPEQLLAEAATAGGKYILASDVTLTSTLEVAKDFELDLNGFTLTNKVENTATDVIVVKEGATLTLFGDGVVEAVSGNDGYAVIAEGKVIINGGTYKSGLDATGDGNCTIYARGKGEVYVNGGNFSTPAGDDTTYVLNKKDADRDNTVIEVKGGTFTNFNPANNPAEGAGTNFVAEGYISKSADGKVWTVSEMTAEDNLVAEATKGGSYTLAEDMVLSQTLVVEKDLTLNLGGKTLSNKDYTMRSATPTTDVIIVKEGATLTLEGDGVVEAVSGNDGYAVVAEGKVIINGGTYKSGLDATGDGNCTIYARGKGEVYINGGNFSTPEGDDTAYVINKKDADRDNTVIEVKGGTFVNFDPANNPAEGAGTNFCAKGYTTEAAEVDGKMVYTVVAAKTVLATPAVETAVEGNVVTLTWKAVEGAAEYAVTVGEETVVVEDTTYEFTGEYETEYAFTVVAVAAADSAYLDSEAAQVTATTEAEPVVEDKVLTVAEFLALSGDDVVPSDAPDAVIAAAPLYTLKGTITSVTQTTYGNFYLNDGTGEVLIYGLCSPEGAQKYWAESGAKVGDDIVVKTIRTEYNKAPQGKNALFVELLPGTLAFWSFETTATSFTAAGGEKEIGLAIYNAAAEVVAKSNNEQFSASYADGVLTVVAQENTSTEEGIEGEITVTCGNLSQVITVSQSKASASGEDKEAVDATLSFAEGANRTSFSTSQQVWEQNDIKVINDKGSSTSNVADYVNPARFYKSSKITVSAPGNITTIVFDCNSASYATALKNSGLTGTVSVSSDKVTVTLDGSSNEYVISSLTGGQVRMDSITVTYLQ